MELRVMELMNNFPEGAMFGARDLGNYCVFGYYDALDLNLGTDAGQGIHVPAESQYSSWENRSRAVMRKINGDAKVIDLSLAFSKEDVVKEKQFWEDKSYAFLSVSIIRIDDMSGIMGKISNQNNSESRMVYYSYEHCEVLAAYHSNSYQDIIAEIHNLRKLFSAVKIYTIFAVAESLLENELELEKRMNISVQHERVSVRMNATMNNPTKIREFRNKLRSMLEVDGVKPEIHIYDLLGDDD